MISEFLHNPAVPTYTYFYTSVLKGLLGASSNRIVRPFVRNSVPITYKVQYLKYEWLYSNQTWTVSSSMGCSHFTDTNAPGEMYDLEILPDFDFVAAGGICVSQTHVQFNTVSCLF